MPDPRRYLIDPNLIVHRGEISEADLKARLMEEAIEQAGWLGPDGKPIAGVTATVHRGRDRRGGYAVEVMRDLSKSDQPRLAAPEGGA